MADWRLTIDNVTWLTATGGVVPADDPAAVEQEIAYTIVDGAGVAAPQDTVRFPKGMSDEALGNSLAHRLHMRKYPPALAVPIVQGGQVTLADGEPTVVSSKNPVGFRQALIGALAGATRAEKFQRAKTLRQRFPGFTEPFLRALDGPDLNTEEETWVKALWADAVGKVGDPTGEIITAAERDAIAALAPTYGISLV